MLLLWIFYVNPSCVCYAFAIICLFAPCGHLLSWVGLTGWLSFVVYGCEFVTLPLVSWVGCDACIYRFFAPLPTLYSIALTNPIGSERLIGSGVFLVVNCIGYIGL